MATYNRTATGGGTAGHPANASVPYVPVDTVADSTGFLETSANTT